MFGCLETTDLIHLLLLEVLRVFSKLNQIKTYLSSSWSQDRDALVGYTLFENS